MKFILASLFDLLVFYGFFYGVTRFNMFEYWWAFPTMILWAFFCLFIGSVPWFALEEHNQK